jgi:hypothetical protein
MDLAWLNPITLAETLIGIVVLVVVLRATGFSISKDKGISFGTMPNALQRIETALEHIKQDITELKTSDARQDEALRHLACDWYKQQVYNEAAPYLDRVYAGLKYKDLGGNSEAWHYFNTTLRDIDPSTFDIIVRNWRKSA